MMQVIKHPDGKVTLIANDDAALTVLNLMLREKPPFMVVNYTADSFYDPAIGGTTKLFDAEEGAALDAANRKAAHFQNLVAETKAAMERLQAQLADERNNVFELRTSLARMDQPPAPPAVEAGKPKKAKGSPILSMPKILPNHRPPANQPTTGKK